MLNPIRLWKAKGEIFEGIVNNMFKKSHVEAIADERMKICTWCDFIDEKGKDCAVPGTQPCCSKCGCSLKLKTRSLSSSCPENFWTAEISEREEDELEKHLNKE